MALGRANECRTGAKKLGGVVDGGCGKRGELWMEREKNVDKKVLVL